MRRVSPVVILLAVAALASMASLLAGLRHALRGREKPEHDIDPKDERARIRAAMGDMLAPSIDFSLYPERLRPRPGMPDRDTLRQSMPILDPPLSQTVREERDESPY